MADLKAYTDAQQTLSLPSHFWFRPNCTRHRRLVSALGIRSLLDSVFGQTDRQLLNLMVIGMLGLFIVQSLISFGSHYLIDWTGRRGSRTYARKLMPTSTDSVCVPTPTIGWPIPPQSAEEALGTIRVVKAFTREFYEVRRYHDESEALFKFNRHRA